MNAESNAIRLSTRELMYLRNTDFLPASLAQLIEAAQFISDDKYALSVPRDIAEQFRSTFTDRLAKVGFGADYEPTSEGKVLEDLIDRFYSG
ncbi:MAG TPA: hypothetical protein VJA26_16445 [Gammaproteobacteria bacterium]|nr:hypothetical protein [Gammaproteobacteria bacterium]